MTTTSLDQIAEACATCLRATPSGVFTDFDGTLSEIALTPDDAVAADGAEQALRTLAAIVDVTGIVTGRAVDDVLRRVDVPGLTVVGNHGLEWFSNGERIDHEAGLSAEEGTRLAMAAIERRMGEAGLLDGMIFENKRLSASIHYRNAVDPVLVERTLIPIAEEAAEANGLRIAGGKMVLELRPRVRVSKGTAMDQLVQMYSLKGAVFFGDDVTDVDGFRSLHVLRDDGQVSALAVAVLSPDVHPDVVAESDYSVDSVASTVELFQRIAEKLTAGKG